ncbi:DUF7483 domain-containing protein, partial [Lactococcus petauri]|uniref:DUF7483 domain-containing protein n=1 Tax=Lactococcus petauri TaxID=1940789 RepID=UPI003F68F233
MNYGGLSFKRAAKFLDIVIWSGDGNETAGGRVISHALGATPGLVVIKRRNSTNSPDYWLVWHRSISTTGYLKLNTTDAKLTTSKE